MQLAASPYTIVIPYMYTTIIVYSQARAGGWCAYMNTKVSHCYLLRTICQLSCYHSRYQQQQQQQQQVVGSSSIISVQLLLYCSTVVRSTALLATISRSNSISISVLVYQYQCMISVLLIVVYQYGRLLIVLLIVCIYIQLHCFYPHHIAITMYYYWLLIFAYISYIKTKNINIAQLSSCICTYRQYIDYG